MKTRSERADQLAGTRNVDRRRTGNGDCRRTVSSCHGSERCHGRGYAAVARDTLFGRRTPAVPATRLPRQRLGLFHLILDPAADRLGTWTLRGRARWTAVALAALSAIAQVGVLPAFPLWALIIIGLDVIIIYGLTARWEQRA